MWEIQAMPAEEQQKWAWATYPGNWGAPLAAQPTVIYCLTDNREGGCC